MQLAQVNVSQMRTAYDSPEMADFVARIPEINALADAAPGFVWRHEGDAGYEQGGAFPDDWLVNLSVWEDLESLWAFVHNTRHRELLRDRRRWFDALDGPALAMWWVPDGHRPSLEEAADRLARLRRHGASPHAFDAASPHGADGVRRAAPIA